MGSNTVSTFNKMLDVNTPIIYIQDYDFVRIDVLIKQVVGLSSKIEEWNPANGLIDFRTKSPKGTSNFTSLSDYLKSVYNIGMRVPANVSFVVLRDIQDYINPANNHYDPSVKTFLQLIAERKLYDRDFETTIIIVSSVLKIPQEIEKFVSFLEIGFPEEEEIRQIVNEHIEVNGYDKRKFSEEDLNKLMPSLKGMTLFEIDRMLDMAMSSNGSLSAEDKEMILVQKKQMVRKSGVLELVDVKESIDNIGGMEVLKKYLKRKAAILREDKLSEAVNFGVAIPKGIFIVGMPGCGKSLCAKASSALFDAPLLKMDMGSMMGKYVGESEANLRKAIKIAEAAAPCILWIDEIEKAFSGIGGNNDIMTRMFGYFLSWMQDKDSCVFVIATANNADKLPPELKRKGRFDEIFCVNLPNETERESIFNIHINKKRKKNCKIDPLNFEELVKLTNGFNGADIESVVNEAVEKCFLGNMDKDGNYKCEKLSLSMQVLKDVIKDTKSISMSCKKQIEEMNKLFKENNFTDASS